MSNPTAGENTLVFTAEEFAAEIGYRVRFVQFLTERDALGSEVTITEGKYYITEENLAAMKESNRKLKEEMRYAFENGDEIRRKVIRELVLESSGIDEETATRLGL